MFMFTRQRHQRKDRRVRITKMPDKYANLKILIGKKAGEISPPHISVPGASGRPDKPTLKCHRERKRESLDSQYSTTTVIWPALDVIEGHPRVCVPNCL